MVKETDFFTKHSFYFMVDKQNAIDTKKERT